MKLTQEEVENCRVTYNKMLEQSEQIWRAMLELEPRKHEWFADVEYLLFEEPNDIVTICGWDGDSSCSINVPMSYFYDEDWMVKKRFEVERANEIKEANLVLEKQKKEKEDEERDLKELARLQEKYGKSKS